MNYLTEFPEFICEIPNLQENTLNKNHISFIPDSINQLYELQGLYIQDNQLKSISHSIQNLNHLNVINMQGNHISQIPEWICNLEYLEGLYLQRNNIAEIPRALYQMKHLKALYLDQNRIKNFEDNVIPDEFIQDLSLVGNPLEPFFQEFLSNFNTPLNLRRFNHFIPYLYEKIHSNTLLDHFDEKFPFYGKYRDILEKFIKDHPTSTAQRIKEILDAQGIISFNENMSILL